MKKIRHFFEYVTFIFVAGFILLLPLKWVQALGSRLGKFAFTTLGFRRKVTLDNLRHAFPELSEDRIVEIAEGAFRSVGIAFMELLWMPRMDRSMIKHIIKLENPETIHEALSRGRGLVLVTAHFGNWELCPQAIVVETGIPIYVIMKPQVNPWVDRKINRWRESFGNIPVPMSVAVREVTKALREGKPVGIAGDQTAAQESLWVEFFGRKVPTHPGTAAFALKNGAPMLIGFAIRQPHGDYKLRFEEIPTDDLTEYTPEAVEELTKRHVQVTEHAIRQYPEQWMWMHRRWKHVPKHEHRVEKVTAE